jgi:hypothetical protein
MPSEPPMVSFYPSANQLPNTITITFYPNYPKITQQENSLSYLTSIIIKAAKGAAISITARADYGSTGKRVMEVIQSHRGVPPLPPPPPPTKI